VPLPKKQRDKRKESKIDDSWLLPYADMLTLLLALFVILFAMSEIDIKKFEQLAYIFQTEFTSGAGVIDDGVSIVPEEKPVQPIDDTDEENEKEEEKEEDKKSEAELDKLGLEEYEELLHMQENIEEYITTNSLTETLGTKLTSEGLLVTVRTDITFDSGSAQVKEEGIEIAKEIASFLVTDPPHEIVVNGHTDNVPIHNEEFASNWELSTMRAIQFMYLLLDDSEIEPKWFSARGYGEYRPVVQNTNAENRAINRRVEVLILPNHDIEQVIEEVGEEI